MRIVILKKKLTNQIFTAVRVSAASASNLGTGVGKCYAVKYYEKDESPGNYTS